MRIGFFVHSLKSASVAARSTGPKTNPRNPKDIMPPKTPRNTSAKGIDVPRLMRMGLMKLSTELTAKVPQSTIKTAIPTLPVA